MTNPATAFEIRWTPTDHYDAAIQALANHDPHTAIAHACLGILRALTP
jgi:hypothetical protein